MDFSCKYFVIFSFLLSFLQSEVVASQVIAGSPVGCKGPHAKLQHVTLAGKILLNKNFIPPGNLGGTGIIEEAVEVQVKHLIGHFKNDVSGETNAALAAYRGPLEILRSKNVAYGGAFKIANDLPASRGLPRSDYTKRAIERGFVAANDEAVLVAYQIGLMIADCGPHGFLTNHSISLPLDPYLSLWIDESKREPRTFGPSKLDVVSRCSSNEIVLFGNSDQNWFFWSPHQVEDGGCKLRPSTTFRASFSITKPIDELVEVPKEFFGKSKKLRFSAIFGVVDQSELFAPTDFARYKKVSMQTLEACKKKMPIPECLSSWDNMLGPQPNNKILEPGGYHFFVFLKYLRTFIEFDSIKLEDTSDEEILLVVDGRFLDSGTPIAFSIYYGKTSLDHGPRVSTSYLKLLHDSFSGFDSISYVGHAGLGQNLSVKTLEKFWEEEKFPEIAREKPLWLGIYNCEAFSYFGFDLDRIFKQKSYDVILTESSGAESGAKFPLSQLHLIKSLFLENRPGMKEVMARYVSGRHFLMSLRLSPSSNE